MTKFTCVDDRSRLWQVENLVTDDQLQDIISLDWIGIEKSDHSAFLKRKIVDTKNNDVQRVSSYITNNLHKVNQALGTSFHSCYGDFWVDYPGFTIDMHTDGHLSNTMQLYWIVSGPEHGTGFYFYKNKSYLLYQFQSIPNTGYIMLNDLDPDGSQPLQWHGMFNPVPVNSIRVSSYWYFY